MLSIICLIYLLIFLIANLEKTVKIDVSTVEIEERGVKVRLTVVDTPGYGDAIDNTDWFVLYCHYNKFMC